MNSEDNKEMKNVVIREIWQNGIVKAGLYHLSFKMIMPVVQSQNLEQTKSDLEGTDFLEDEELLARYIETIDLVMEHLLEFSEDIEDWKNQTPDEKKGELYNLFFQGSLSVTMSLMEELKEQGEGLHKSSFDEAMNIIEEIANSYRKCKYIDSEAGREIIVRAFSRAANREVESGIDLEPGKELISSEKIAELEITKEKLTMSFLLDPQVKSTDCVNGEFIVNTINGEMRFRLVFGDEDSGGRA